jgi:hypothetical protein
MTKPNPIAVDFIVIAPSAAAAVNARLEDFERNAIEVRTRMFHKLWKKD